jgi:NADPH-dependent 2,4-dienoyl-CoA reductase/sulfur reductase-like enzyme
VEHHTPRPTLCAPATSSSSGSERDSFGKGPRVSAEAIGKRRRRVVIVGGGFGGLAAARKLRHAEVDVTLVDRVNHHLF